MTRATLVLVGHSLRRIRGLLIGLGVMLAAFEFLLTQVAAYLMGQNAFSQLSALIPDFVRNAAGPSLLGFMSYTGVVGLGYFHPIVLTSLVGLMIAVATEPSGEVETRFVDLTLARRLARQAVIARTIAVLIVSGSLMLVLMIGGTWVGVTFFAPEGAERPSLTMLVSLAVTLAAVMACWAGVALAIAAGAKRRSVAGGIAGALALGSYLLDYLGRAWQPASGVSRLSPFHYFEPMAVVLGGPVSGGNLTVLIVVAAIGTLIGFVAFAKRDV
jgi:ABC-2 type transport system permease protein